MCGVAICLVMIPWIGAVDQVGKAWAIGLMGDTVARTAVGTCPVLAEREPPLNSRSPTGSMVLARRSSSNLALSSSDKCSLGAITGGTLPSESQACLQQSAMDIRLEGSICMSLKMKSMPVAEKFGTFVLKSSSNLLFRKRCQSLSFWTGSALIKSGCAVSK